MPSKDFTFWWTTTRTRVMTCSTLQRHWLRLWRALTAVNTWEDELKGRIFLDLINEPDEHKFGWDGPMPSSQHTASLSEYYLAVMDALYQEAGPDATLFFFQVGFVV